MNSKLKNKISHLPDSPGVYIFKDLRGTIIYIGKAKSLKKRVQSYFSRFLSTKTQAMVAKITDIEYKLAPSESQAQILEAALIKENQPQYNISLKDDKSFPWIRISRETFPVVAIARRKRELKGDAALYFGPYTDVKLLRQAFKIMRRIFAFRSCKTLPKAICLYGRINLCPAPCIEGISVKDYHETIERIKMFLDSRYEGLIYQLSEKMKELSGEKRFEEAGQVRDQINALKAIAQGQPDWYSVNELEDLRRLLKLEKMPLRIEAFDISNICGKEAAGAMVSFYRGKPDKDNYRRFRIRSVEGINDYRMLGEVIQRRYSRLAKEGLDLPDLVLIDGGRAHLSVAQKQIQKLKLNIPLVSIAKDRENLYIINRRKPINLNADTPALNLIRMIRDEAHRFAIKYHHLLRRKKIIGE